MDDIPMKKCTGPCGQEYLATKKFFYKQDLGKYGLTSKCKECLNEINKAYKSRPKVRDRIRERDRDYYGRPEIKERYRLQGKEYRTSLEVKVMRRGYNHNRRSGKKSILGSHTPKQIQDQINRQRHKCYYCHARFKRQKSQYIYHIEHTFPLSRVAGTDIPANSIDYLVLSCPTCNLSKGDKFPWEWAEGGRLL